MNIMKRQIVKHFTISLAALVCLLALTCDAFAQASAKVASATPVNKTTGRSSSVSIRENELNLYKANLERQLRVAQRCVETARLPVLLRDPQGNVNQVPKIDIVFCSGKVRVLSRELAAVNRQLADLSKDGQLAANYISRKAAEAAYARRLGITEASQE
ncbi:MAG: hypothetical protein AB7V04_11420 [Desulfomonilaceae bacterium]